MSDVSALQEILPIEQVETDQETLSVYGKDWNKLYTAKPSAVVFPKSATEIQKLVEWANSAKKFLVPSGGRTGLSGGAVAEQGEIVVSLDKMNTIGPVNPSDATVSCQAGAVLQNLQEAVAKEGFYFPVDFGARGSAQMGGVAATNAGGLKVVRYGMMRDWVAGLKVVTGKGEIIEMDKALLKDNTGYDIKNLFVGSEGTLGFITDLTLRLTNPPGELTVFLLGLNELAPILDILVTFRRQLSLSAFEFFSKEALEYVISAGKGRNPLNTDCPYFLLAEFEDKDDKQMEIALELFEQVCEKNWVVDGTISQSQSQSEELWDLRDNITESITPRFPHKNDISVPIRRIPEFLQNIDTLTREKYPDFEVIWFGHIGDGNLHFNVLKPEGVEVPEFRRKCKDLDQILYAQIQKFGGSVSAEHGVGLTKKAYLLYSRSQAEMDYMRQIKKLFDPNGVLNPGKIFE